MKLINYLLIALVFVSSCKEESDPEPSFSKDYGDGMYIVTDNGISFYDGEVVKSQIYKKVNGSSILNGYKMKFSGTKAYIVTGSHIFAANIQTFENKEVINGFADAVDFDFVSHDRLFVVDKGDSKVKVVDLASSNITSDIETGDFTRPSFIVSNWYRSYVLNSGSVMKSLKDTTIIAIDYKDIAIPLADFMGSIVVGENPNSAVWNGNIKVLCGGIFNPNNNLNNTESSLYNIHPLEIEVNWSETLNGIYNARNLIESPTSSRFYFLAEGGVYWMPKDASFTTQIFNIESDVLLRRTEWYAKNDSTDELSDMLYVNDAVGANNTIYKYNLATSSFCDTIIVDGNVRDINFY